MYIYRPYEIYVSNCNNDVCKWCTPSLAVLFNDVFGIQ